jgi:hypothetical protein
MTNHTPNYPDILGYITHGKRINVNVIQAAVAIRPRIVRTGRNFAVIILIQNAADVDVDITVSFQLPEQDAARNKERFQTEKNRLLIGLRPAEVGFVTLPAYAHPETAPSNAYKASVEISAKPLAKPQRIRSNDGAADFQLQDLSEDAQALLENLQPLAFVTETRFLRSSVEVPFSVISGRAEEPQIANPGWTSLWTMADLKDEGTLFSRYHTQLKNTLPRLTRNKIVRPLYEATQKYFSASGYTLSTPEALFILKQLTLIVEMAAPLPNEQYDYRGLDKLRVMEALEQDFTPNSEPPQMASWAWALLQAHADHEQMAEHQPELLLRDKNVYAALIHDAIQHGSLMIEQSTGEPLGEECEIEEYAEQVSHKIRRGEALTYGEIYLPLILSGVIVYDRAMSLKENVSDTLSELTEVISNYAGEDDEDEIAFIHALAKQLINRSLQKYGFQI